jgi:uncharacterized damage-inducible protein DinB
MPTPEYWLRGPVDDVIPLLQPVAHALLQARDDISAAAAPLSAQHVWMRPGDAAPVGFHMKHLAGSLDRLLTYARGEQISPEQLAYLKAEAIPGEPAADAASLVALVNARIDTALQQVRTTPEHTLLDARRVGRQGLLSTTIGLLFHAAEHTTRHAGQIITTARIVTSR